MQALSGEPTRCRAFVDLLAADARLFAPDSAPPFGLRERRGQRAVFQLCEQMTAVARQLDVFATSDAFAAGASGAVAFTALLRTPLRCRLPVAGTAMWHVAADGRIDELRVVLDAASLAHKLAQCTLPSAGLGTNRPPSEPSENQSQNTNNNNNNDNNNNNNNDDNNNEKTNARVRAISEADAQVEL